ncbi:MAG: ROK family protein [Ignavibacteriaceae bacterium]|nr:ROK family protein [Ignavibacteriaceae bacterium]
MIDKTIIGVDVGGTNISLGRVEKDQFDKCKSFDISAQGTKEKILKEIINAIYSVFDDNVAGIGIGVPSLVDVNKGIVYNVQNIPSWDEVHLKDILEEQFGIPVYVNNDANCFTIGEKYFGKGKRFSNMVGLTIGTGLGAGIFINNRLYSGTNCGAGEFGSIPYKDQTFEFYCSGKFFKKVYNIEGNIVFEKAKLGDTKALKIFEVFGYNLGDAIQIVLYSVDPEAIILGGSVSRAYPYFSDAMWARVNKFQYQHSLKNLVIEVTTQLHISILGAAALYYDAHQIDLITKA